MKISMTFKMTSDVPPEQQVYFRDASVAELRESAMKSIREECEPNLDIELIAVELVK